MWLKDSSIGRKFVMSLTGLALVFFLLFHGCMNLVVVFSEEWYNFICEVLGANWYALIGTMGLAFLVLVHFCYAFYLTNMLVLGIIVICFLVLHLYNFWFRMQLAEITDGATAGAFSPTAGAAYVKALFVNGWCGIVYCCLYLVWLVALWFHLRHGVWSALHTLGMNNLKWMKRIKVLGVCIATIVVAPFTIVVLFYLGMGIGNLC